MDGGSTAVRFAEVAAWDIPVIVRASQGTLPPGVVEAGEVRQPAAVAYALRELWSKAGVKSKQVHLGVENQRVVVRELALPWLPEKDLRDTLGFQVQEFIPMAADGAVLDFDPLGMQIPLETGSRRSPGSWLPLLLLVYSFVLRPDGGEDLTLPSGPTGITGSTGAPTESPSVTPSPTPRETLPPVSLAGSRDPFSIPPGLELSTGGSVSPTTTVATFLFVDQSFVLREK